MLKIITIWERYNKQQEWEHNHIDDGHAKEETKPKPINTFQKNSWKNVKWRKFEARLVNGKVERINT